jgi:hypothetical protein
VQKIKRSTAPFSYTTRCRVHADSDSILRTVTHMRATHTLLITRSTSCRVYSNNRPCSHTYHDRIYSTSDGSRPQVSKSEIGRADRVCKHRRDRMSKVGKQPAPIAAAPARWSKFDRLDDPRHFRASYPTPEPHQHGAPAIFRPGDLLHTRRRRLHRCHHRWCNHSFRRRRLKIGRVDHWHARHLACVHAKLSMCARKAK